MGDKMIPVSFKDLLSRVITEYERDASLFGISKEHIYRKSDTNTIPVFNQTCAMPIGPAAGPHTQLAQNIIASYLAGGRFIELKTVQILDTLEIEKPCIDARDEGYNVEWSTEYTLQAAYDEYIKAWIVLHFIEALIPTGSGDSESINRGSINCIFNMSVGYDLAGIKSDKMQKFIDSMIDSSGNELFKGYLNELDSLIDNGSLFFGTCFEGKTSSLKGLSKKVPANISPSVTLSTMHGCPPEEIEAICSYMLVEKGLHTFVKLNPTLLGYETVRTTLDNLGYTYITLNRDSFEHDLKYDDAVSLLQRLILSAKKQSLGFGVKLTNTLGTVNDQDTLPGKEMYMSGRALFPLSIQLAAKLSLDFSGMLPVSYSGGASAVNIQAIFETGIRPITIATDLLKPGGYARLNAMAAACEASGAWSMQTIDTEKLSQLAESAVSDKDFHKEKRGYNKVHVDELLPLTDCYVAPCVQACPIHQDVPEYIHLTGQGRYAEAIELIYDKNPLPNITGHICDHQCMYNCTRIDYEGPVEIRTLKRIAVDNGFAAFKKKLWEKPQITPMQAAVIGAGPAGLSAAYFLARSGFSVTVFEKEPDAGGVVNHIIPEFRLPQSAVEADIAFVREQGVEFCFGALTEELTIKALQNRGFSYVLYAVGAEKDNPIPLGGSRDHVIEALDFLSRFRKERESLKVGEYVAVAGGGNTAMDSARAALTLPGVKGVSILYRRTKHEMPADLEEFDNALEEGAKFIFLSLPEYFDGKGGLVCRKMILGEPDSSGRRRPEATNDTFTVPAETLITAIGEQVDSKALKEFGIPLNGDGWASVDEETLETKAEGVYLIGDAQTGPSTIVRCIAGARKAVEAILDKELGNGFCDCGENHENCSHDDNHDLGNSNGNGNKIEVDEDELSMEELEKAENMFFAEIIKKKNVWQIPADPGLNDGSFAAHEAGRCLECSYICNKCVEVCPNRANVAVDVRDLGLFDDPYQIIHLDAYCNECGNCAAFCPWNGKPYKDKITIFNTRENMMDSTNPGFLLTGDTLSIRVQSETVDYPVLDGVISGEIDENFAELIQLIVDDYPYLLGRK
ncbi:MAG: putative selenate reductase subunit YgfK [Spirochaetales bacterium]|nr:putative selenate reductase subunit YgfK [Spirochaetales bacterium]